MCGTPSHFLPLLQTQAAYTISFVSSTGGALPDGSSFWWVLFRGRTFAAVNKGEGERGRQKLFFKALALNWSTGHWRCIHETNTNLLMPLYILLYNRKRRMSTTKVGAETWWCVCRHFLWRILRYTYQHCMRCVEKLEILISERVLLTWTYRLFFVSSLFMMFILLPCCFGEPLGNVTLWMRMW